VDADAESSIDLITVEQPTHADKHQVKIVDGRTLHDPVHSARHELNTDTHTACQTYTPEIYLLRNNMFNNYYYYSYRY